MLINTVSNSTIKEMQIWRTPHEKSKKSDLSLKFNSNMREVPHLKTRKRSVIANEKKSCVDEPLVDDN